MIYVTEHRILIVNIGRINSTFVLIAVSPVPAREQDTPTLMSKPICAASALTSSRSSSIEGSLVVFSSKCQRSGPSIGARTSESRRNHTNTQSQDHTQINPDTARSENSMDDSKVIHDIFRLRKSSVNSTPYITRERALTVSMKKHVSTASHTPADGSSGSSFPSC